MTKTQEIKHLHSRWSATEIAKALATLQKQPFDPNGCPFPSIEIDGETHVDLRGITTEATILRLAAELIDLSYSSIGFGFANLKNCLFVGSVHEGNLSDTFFQCDFSAAKMRRVRTITGAVFDNCKFVETDLANANFSNTRFANCDFTGARFLRAEFFRCVFDGCRFENAKFGTGCLGDCVFHNSRESFSWTDYDTGKPMRHSVADALAEVSFKKTMLLGVRFE